MSTAVLVMVFVVQQTKTLLLHTLVGAAAASAPVPVVWANSTQSPFADVDCTAAANGTTPAQCECGRLASFFTEAEVATYEYVESTIVQRLDPKRTAAMTTNATLQVCRLPPWCTGHVISLGSAVRHGTVDLWCMIPS